MKFWLTENKFINFEEKKQGITEEIATRKRAINYTSFLGFLPNPDSVLKKQGKDISIYEELTKDSHAGSCILSRKSGVLSLEYGIDKGKSKNKYAKLIEEILEKINIYNLIESITKAPLYGYQPLEIMWEYVNGLILPTSIIAKPPEWFMFSEDNNLLFKSANNLQGELLPDKKFLCPVYNGSYKNPYGEPELSKIFWPVTFKKGGLKFWVIFTEKYGMPFLIGKYQRGASNEEIEKLLDTMENMLQDAVAAIPEDAQLEIKEPLVKSSSANIYKELLKQCEEEISKAIIGQTLTTQVGEKGSYAASKIHQEVRKDIIIADKKLVEHTINELIKWILELNFGNVEAPKFSMWEKEDVDKDLAERDDLLTKNGNVKLTKQYYMRSYSFNEDEIITNESFTQPTQTTKEFAETATEEEIKIPEKDLETQENELIKPILKMVEQTKDYEELYKNLIEIYPKLQTKELENSLSKAIFISETAGRLNI